MKQRVLIYGMNYSPELAGVGRYTGEIGEFLATLGQDVCVVTTPPHYPGWKPLHGYSAKRWTRERSSDVDIYRCPLYLHENMKGIRRLLAPLSFAISSAPVAIYQILKRRPDIVIAIEPTLFAAPAALLAARLAGAKTVLHVQDLEVDAAFAVGHLQNNSITIKVARFFERAIMRRFDRVITISHRMSERVLAKSVERSDITVIRNWVDIDLIRPLDGPSSYRRELNIPNDVKVVLYSGNIGAKQGVGLVIDAAERLADRNDIVFVIAGEGPLRAAVDAASKRLPNLRLLGFQPEARFADFLGLADIHVLPQEKNAADLLLPSKLGGMLASGKRIVVTAEPGTELAEFLGTSCTLTSPGDAAALSQVIANLASEAPSALMAKARLTLAASLSKQVLLPEFARVVLFPRSSP